MRVWLYRDPTPVQIVQIIDISLISHRIKAMPNIVFNISDKYVESKRLASALTIQNWSRLETVIYLGQLIT